MCTDCIESVNELQPIGYIFVYPPHYGNHLVVNFFYSF